MPARSIQQHQQQKRNKIPAFSPDSDLSSALIFGRHIHVHICCAVAEGERVESELIRRGIFLFFFTPFGLALLEEEEEEIASKAFSSPRGIERALFKKKEEEEKVSVIAARNRKDTTKKHRLSLSLIHFLRIWERINKS